MHYIFRLQEKYYHKMLNIYRLCYKPRIERLIMVDIMLRATKISNVNQIRWWKKVIEYVIAMVIRYDMEIIAKRFETSCIYIWKCQIYLSEKNT